MCAVIVKLIILSLYLLCNFQYKFIIVVYMNRFIILLGLVPVLNCFAEVPETVRTMMSCGEFAAASEALEKCTEATEFEKDSINEIMDRIRSDFRIPYAEGVKAIQEKFPFVTTGQIERWIGNKYIETKIIDGKEYMFRKTVSNLDRLVPELSADKSAEQLQTSSEYMRFASDAINGEESGKVKKYRAKVRVTMTLHDGVVPLGTVVRAWGPFPVENGRQNNIKLLSSSDNVTYSSNSLHNTVYMEKCAEAGKPTVFEYELSYDVVSKYYSPDYILKNKKPYDKNSEVYRKYTSDELPQFIIDDEMRSLALGIVGNETDPLRQASLVYDWIDAYFPWAGAREYSTIGNLARYVLDRGYGDCGQVSSLYITLLRALGIPARWESGWMVQPGNVGMHDWAEVYYEGIGWVPVDMSFGILRTAADKKARNFYKTGIDVYRFASNKGVGGKLSPEKKFVRSETVDFQLGEMEYDGGNFFYYRDWTPDFELISFEELK